MTLIWPPKCLRVDSFEMESTNVFSKLELKELFCVILALIIIGKSLKLLESSEIEHCIDAPTNWPRKYHVCPH